MSTSQSWLDASREAARELARCGVPLFMAPPDPTARLGYRLPMRWEREARADPGLVDALPEGWALCAVMGCGLDLLDIDPRNAEHGTELPALPPALAVAETPSGGQHRFVLSLGLPSLDGVVPGLDYKGGDPTGAGRGFAFIAPTRRTSKADGLVYPYQWLSPPNASMFHGSQGVGPTVGYDELRVAITARRAARARGAESRMVPAAVASREWRAALDRLAADLRHWSAHGWGGEAHAGLLAHTTHLARLGGDSAEAAYAWAFEAAGLAPDADDLAKLDSALRTAVADTVIPDAEVDAESWFWDHGRPDPRAPGPKAPAPPADPAAGRVNGPFAFTDPAPVLDRKSVV